MKAFRSALLLAGIILAASAAFADVTLKSTMATTAGTMSIEMASVAYVKGLAMRTDITGQGQDMSMFVDVSGKRQVLFNNATKQAQDLGAAMADMPFVMGEIKSSIKPNGQTKTLLGYECAGYDIEMSMPMTIMSEDIAIQAAGTVWIAKNAPGDAEYRAFSKAAVEAGLMTAPFGQGPQAKGLAQFQASFLEKGIPLEQQMQMTFSGVGQMFQTMAQAGMGNYGMTMQVTSISVDPIPAGTLAFPGDSPKK